MAITARLKVFAELLGSLNWRAPFIPTPYESAVNAGDIREYQIPDGTVNQLIVFPPGVSTITLLAITGDHAFSLTLGATASNQAKNYAAGAIVVHAGIVLAASNTVYISYNPSDGSILTLLILYAGS